MPQFLLIHKVQDYPDSQDEWIDMWRSIRKRAKGEVEWLHSFYEPSSGKLYCEWKAPSLEAILECMSEEVIKIAPIEITSEVVLFDLKWLDENESM
jgi:hypothetical protein